MPDSDFIRHIYCTYCGAPMGHEKRRGKRTVILVVGSGRVPIYLHKAEITCSECGTVTWYHGRPVALEALTHD